MLAAVAVATAARGRRFSFSRRGSTLAPCCAAGRGPRDPCLSCSRVAVCLIGCVGCRAVCWWLLDALADLQRLLAGACCPTGNLPAASIRAVRCRRFRRRRAAGRIWRCTKVMATFFRRCRRSGCFGRDLAACPDDPTCRRVAAASATLRCAVAGLSRDLRLAAGTAGEMSPRPAWSFRVAAWAWLAGCRSARRPPCGCPAALSLFALAALWRGARGATMFRWSLCRSAHGAAG